MRYDVTYSVVDGENQITIAVILRLIRRNHFFIRNHVFLVGGNTRAIVSFFSANSSALQATCSRVRVRRVRLG